MTPEPLPGFDAVAESRKWREATSRHLFSMSREERVEYLATARASYLAGETAAQEAEGTCAVREEPPER